MAERDPRAATTLMELMRRRAVLSPQTPYFNLYDETVTYGALWERTGRYAAGLARAGVGQGDKVALIYPTCAEFFYSFFGAIRLGAVPVPLYPTLGVEATATILRDSETIAVTTIGWFRKGVDAAVELASSVRAVLEPQDLEADARLPALPTVREDDLAFLQYTSGSTGHPRGVMLTHANVVSTCHSMAEAAGITADDRVVSWLPLYHDMGLIGCCLTPPLTTTGIWLLPPDLRNPRGWLELITRVRATFTVSPDFGYRNCLRHVRDTSDLDLTSLKAALSGAESVRPSTIEAFERHFGLKRVVCPCYGLAEATLAVAIWPRGVPLRFDPSGRFVSVGQPCPGISVKIVEPVGTEPGGPFVRPPTPGAGLAAPATTEPGRSFVRPPTVEAGREVPVTVEGEVCVRSPGVMRGYYGNPAATASVLTPDGWLRTGDLGFVDRDGFLYITGRLKDVMCLGGENVVPSDIEELVDHVAGVRYSAAVATESDRTGTQRLHVVAEVRDESGDVNAHHRLASEIVRRVHKARGHRPARVLLVRTGTIPKTSSGKIQRSRLTQMLVAGELHDRLVYATGAQEP